MRVVAVFRNGDKVMDGSVDVWVLAVPLPPWTAAHLHAPTSLSDIAVDMAVDSGVRTTEQYLATTRHRVGWTQGFEGWRRRAAPRRQKCSRWAGPSLCCGTSAASAAEVDAFVAALTAREQEARPSADGGVRVVFTS